MARGHLKRSDRIAEDVSSELSACSMIFLAKRARMRGCFKRCKHFFEDVSSETSNYFKDVPIKCISSLRSLKRNTQLCRGCLKRNEQF
eukprot:9495094-Pyramimonas_sp.AAC.1